MQLDIRNPAWGLFNAARRGFYEALFSVSLVAVVIAAKETPLLFGRTADVFPHTLWSLSEFGAALAIVAAFVGLALLSSPGGAEKGGSVPSPFWGWPTCRLRFPACSWSISGHWLKVARSLCRSLLVTTSGLGAWPDAERLTPELGTLRLLIYPVLVTGGAFSWGVLGRLQRQHGFSPIAFAGHRLLILLAAAAFLRIL